MRTAGDGILKSNSESIEQRYSSAIFGKREMSGDSSPRSHLDTVCADTPSASATSSCVSLREVRSSFSFCFSSISSPACYF